VRYRDYLAWEGACSIVLGGALMAVAFPGLLVDWSGLWTAPLFALALLAALAAFARLRHGVPPARPGRWLTERPLREAAAGLRPLDAGRLRRRLLTETALWIVAVVAWVVLARQSGLLIFGTGLASVAFGAVQAFPARRRAEAADRDRGHDHRVARRAGLGTPGLTRLSVPPG